MDSRRGSPLYYRYNKMSGRKERARMATISEDEDIADESGEEPFSSEQHWSSRSGGSPEPPRSSSQ